MAHRNVVNTSEEITQDNDPETPSLGEAIRESPTTDDRLASEMEGVHIGEKKQPTAEEHLAKPPPIDESTSSKTRTEKFQSYIFVDFGTSGLFPLNETNSSSQFGKLRKSRDSSLFSTNLKEFIKKCDEEDRVAPAITEISMVAISRRGFTEMQKKMEREEGSDHSSLRRRVGWDVLTLCLDPNIDKKAKDEHSDEYGWLDEDTLTGKLVMKRFDNGSRKTFKENWPIIRAFLELAPKPAVMIAHNGQQFDFRILYWEMHRYGLLTEGLPREIYFADSMFAFMNIEDAFLKVVHDGLPDGKYNETRWETIREEEECIALKKNFEDNKFIKSALEEYAPQSWKTTFVKGDGRFIKDNLYKKIIGETIGATHWSQDDSEAIMQLAVAYGNKFLGYVEEAAAKFPHPMCSCAALSAAQK